MTRTRFIGTLIVSAFIILVAVSSLRQKASLSTGSEQMPGKAVAYDSYAPTEAPSYGASNRALVGNIVAPQSYGGGATEVTASNRLVVRTGYLSLVVQDVSWTIEQMTAYIVGKGGFVANSTLEKTAVAPVGSLTVRVAAKEYDATLQKMKEFGEVISQTTNGQDITEEYVDLDSRLKNLQATEEQLLAIMKRAGKISEVLEVQNQLTQTRSEIEVLIGRMKYLKQSSEFSTLTVNISTDPSALPVIERDGEKWKPLGVIKDAARQLVVLGQSLVDTLIWVVIFVPVWGGALVVAWLVYRKLRRSTI